MGLILGIVGNLLVSFYIKMVETNYYQVWVISFGVSVVTLINLQILRDNYLS